MSKKSILTFVAGTLLGSIVSALTTRFMLFYEFPKKTKRETKYRSYSLDDDEDDDHSYDNVHVKTEREAEEVKRILREQIEKNGYVSIASLYELTGNHYKWSDLSFGWTSLNSMSWCRTRNQEYPWLLILPRPKDISDLK